jgi:DNA-binding NarL/FixJ family response regulator
VARPTATASLSDREGEVLELVAKGLSNADIAARLCVSRRTAERHCRNIYAKLGVHNRVEATRWALEHGLGR